MSTTSPTHPQPHPHADRPTRDLDPEVLQRIVAESFADGTPAVGVPTMQTTEIDTAMLRELVLEDIPPPLPDPTDDERGEAAAIASLARPGEAAVPSSMSTEIEALPDPLPVGATILAIPRPAPAPTLMRWVFAAGVAIGMLIGTAVGGLMMR